MKAGREPADAVWPRWFWVGLFALGVAVRLRQYGAGASYWYDESYLLLNVFRRSFAELTGAVDYQVVTPVLFLWLERAAYLLLGPAEWAMRLPMTVQSLAALALMVPLARRFCGRGWVWAVALLALSPHAIMHGVDVRPYSGDVLFCQAVLLAAFAALAGEARRRRIGAAALVSLALLGPWLSFPAAFVLGGAGLALFARAAQTRDGRLFTTCLCFGVMAALSVGAVYLVQARHLYYPGLRHHWSRGFPDLGAPAPAILWGLNCFLGMGQYANQSLGVPLLLFSIGGSVVLARRQPALALVLVAPPLLGVMAAFLHRYPMDDRTLFYTAPCVWLLAAAGIGAVLERFPQRRRLLTAAFGLLLLPGLIESCKELVVVLPRADFRAAFVHVRAHLKPGDRVWVTNHEVYESYYGTAPELLTNLTPDDGLIAVARHSRLWLVYTPDPRGERVPERLFPRLAAAGCIPTHRHTVFHLAIVRYDPPTTQSDGAP